MAYWSGGPSGQSNDKGTRNTRHADDWVDYYAEIYNWKLITRFFPFIKQDLILNPWKIIELFL